MTIMYVYDEPASSKKAVTYGCRWGRSVCVYSSILLPVHWVASRRSGWTRPSLSMSRPSPRYPHTCPEYYIGKKSGWLRKNKWTKIHIQSSPPSIKHPFIHLHPSTHRSLPSSLPTLAKLMVAPHLDWITLTVLPPFPIRYLHVCRYVCMYGMDA